MGLHMEKQEGSHLAGMCDLARFGFKTVPTVLQHDEKGAGLMYMDGDGLRFMPFDKKQTPLILTWEEFDRGPDGKATS